MNNKIYLKTFLKISAIFLWYFTPLFLVIISGIGKPLFREGTFLENFIIRNVYQWDYELMFAGFYLVWGIFAWKASENIESSVIFIKFTVWGFFANVIVNLIVGLCIKQELIHLVADSIPWFILGSSIYYFSRKLP